MKVLCVNNEKITLAVPKGYPNTLPDNGNMSLLFLTEIDYRGAEDMKVGEVYEPAESKINFYGHPMYLFDGYYGWRPAAAFIDLDPEELSSSAEASADKEEVEELNFYLEYQDR